ncbi:MAG: AmmeMemoRadiSam system radical SAM enzyme [Gammaproteobacteria bacterium]|nr:AmmeMemoRadiSam system radical SAM enzyme [Gammaproteobacteria bacterium]
MTTAQQSPQKSPTVVTARYWHRLDDGRLQCDLCPRFCKLHEDQQGLCFVRARQGEEIVLTTYGRSSGFCVDPIEKKPLNHFLPGTSVLSFGTAGCNLACKFCQNWDMSKSREMDTLADSAAPKTLARAAKELGCSSVAYTYNDPVIFLEYAVDVAKECRKLGIKNVAVTAGYICEEPRKEFFQDMDAANVDLKAFTEDFYQTVSFSALWPVLRTLKNIHQAGKHLEIVNLVIPTFNDDLEEIRRMCRWILENLGDEVPLHFTRFSPAYQMTRLPSTPIETLEAALAVADAEGLQYVYIGNVPGHERNSTFCPGCGKRIIHRVHFSVLALDVDGDQCHFCGRRIPGVWWPAEEGATEEG